MRIALLLAGAVLVALASGAVGPSTPSDSVQAATSLPRPVRLARNDAAHRRNLRASQVKVVSYKRRTWPDGCLGLGGTGAICTQQLVAGYRAVFLVRGRRVAYRTDLRNLIRVER